MKKYIPAIVWLFVFANGMFIHWLSGGEFVRGEGMAWHYGIALFLASICAALTNALFEGEL